MAKKRRKRSASPKQASPQRKQGRKESPPATPNKEPASSRRVPTGLIGVISIVVVVVLAGALYWASQQNGATSQAPAEESAQPAPAAEQPAAAESEAASPAKAAPQDTVAEGPATEAETAAETVDEEPHALPPTGSQPGFAAPDFTLTNLENEQIALSDFKGKPVFVSFFHTW